MIKIKLGCLSFDPNYCLVRKPSSTVYLMCIELELSLFVLFIQANRTLIILLTEYIPFPNSQPIRVLKRRQPAVMRP